MEDAPGWHRFLPASNALAGFVQIGRCDFRQQVLRASKIFLRSLISAASSVFSRR